MHVWLVTSGMLALIRELMPGTSSLSHCSVDYTPANSGSRLIGQAPLAAGQSQQPWKETSTVGFSMYPIVVTLLVSYLVQK